MYSETIAFIQSIYGSEAFIPLHEPRFIGNEKAYVNATIDSTFVSSVGSYVDDFEKAVAEYCGAKHAVATVNGTAALHIALTLAGVEHGTEVITQPLSFIATANAISYSGASPLFIDVDKETLGLSPEKLETFLSEKTVMDDAGFCINRVTGKKIAACVPMHTFGHPAKIDAIVRICDAYNIAVVEDAAESLGSFYKGRHTGTFGKMGVFSFNGNKIITTGGGGMLITDDANLAKRAKHITTTAKVPHAWEYVHDAIGFNYRLPNLNAALGVAQMESLQRFVVKKRELALRYNTFFKRVGINSIAEPEDAVSNYWLNAVVLAKREARDAFLKETNESGVMTRPVWKLINTMPMYATCQSDNLENAQWLEERVVNIPSSVVIE